MAEATKIQKYIERIDYVELGFTLKRYCWLSVKKSINVIHHLTDKKYIYMIIFIDTEKTSKKIH